MTIMTRQTGREGLIYGRCLPSLIRIPPSVLMSAVMDYSTEYDQPLGIFWIVQACLSVLFNSILLYLVIKKSPVNLHPYRILIANGVVVDIICSISGALTQLRQPRFTTNPVALLNGPVQIVGHELSYALVTLQSIAMIYGLFCFPLSFRFRYRSLKMLRTPSAFSIIFSLTIALTLSAMEQSLIVFDDLVYGEITIIQGKFGSYVFIDEKATMLMDVANVLTPVSVVGVYALSLYYTLRSILLMRNAMKRALLIQISLPVLFILTPTIFFVLQITETFDNSLSEFVSYPLFFTSFLLNSVVNITLIAPYRRALIDGLKRILRVRTANVLDVSTSSPSGYQGT